MFDELDSLYVKRNQLIIELVGRCGRLGLVEDV
jgi:hypothetical protein